MVDNLANPGNPSVLPSFIKVEFIANSASYGAGLAVQVAGAYLQDCVFVYNSAVLSSSGCGGGIYGEIPVQPTFNKFYKN